MGTNGRIKCFMKRSVANRMRKKVNSSDYKPVTLLLRETPIVRNHSTLLGSQYIWRHRLAVRTPPFHGGNVGSNPAGVTSSALRGDRRLWLSKYKTENSLW